MHVLVTKYRYYSYWYQYTTFHTIHTTFRRTSSTPFFSLKQNKVKHSV
jgi:hypothetical protein